MTTSPTRKSPFAPQQVDTPHSALDDQSQQNNHKENTAESVKAGYTKPQPGFVGESTIIEEPVTNKRKLVKQESVIQQANLEEFLGMKTNDSSGRNSVKPQKEEKEKIKPEDEGYFDNIKSFFQTLNPFASALPNNINSDQQINTNSKPNDTTNSMTKPKNSNANPYATESMIAEEPKTVQTQNPYMMQSRITEQKATSPSDSFPDVPNPYSFNQNSQAYNPYLSSAPNQQPTPIQKPPIANNPYFEVTPSDTTSMLHKNSDLDKAEVISRAMMPKRLEDNLTSPTKPARVEYNEPSPLSIDTKQFSFHSQNPYMMQHKNITIESPKKTSTDLGSNRNLRSPGANDSSAEWDKVHNHYSAPFNLSVASKTHSRKSSRRYTTLLQTPKTKDSTPSRLTTPSHRTRTTSLSSQRASR